MEYILILLTALIIINLSAKVNKLEGRMKKMQYTLDHVTKHSEIPENPLIDELRKLIEEGQDVKAIKRVREEWGLSLLEGKEYIDKLKSKK